MREWESNVPTARNLTWLQLTRNRPPRILFSFVHIHVSKSLHSFISLEPFHFWRLHQANTIPAARQAVCTVCLYTLHWLPSMVSSHRLCTGILTTPRFQCIPSSNICYATFFTTVHLHPLSAPCTLHQHCDLYAQMVDLVCPTPFFSRSAPIHSTHICMSTTTLRYGYSCIHLLSYLHGSFAPPTLNPVRPLYLCRPPLLVMPAQDISIHSSEATWIVSYLLSVSFPMICTLPPEVCVVNNCILLLTTASTSHDSWMLPSSSRHHGC
jgi:hypothetical protein